MLRRGLASTVAAMGLIIGPMASAEDMPVTGKIEWGVWVDADGCQHWWADGGTEGYVVPRRDKKTGKPVCTAPKSCLSESTDAFFATASATLTASGRSRLEEFFSVTEAYSFGSAGHTDSRGSDDYNQGLSEARAKTVAEWHARSARWSTAKRASAKSNRSRRTQRPRAWRRTAVSK